MIEFHSKPFLQYLVEMLRAQGFSRVTLLLGYLPEVIESFFGDGRGFGLQIEYSVTAPEDLTAFRLRASEDLLDDRFLLMYCDNYWPMDFAAMWSRYLASGRPVQVTVYDNADGLSRSNVRVGADGVVEVFDRTRNTPGLQGVEIGYAIVDKATAFSLMPAHQILFEEAVYTPLVARRQLQAFVTHHRYYSIGDHDRIADTDDFLESVSA